MRQTLNMKINRSKSRLMTVATSLRHLSPSVVEAIVSEGAA